MFFFIIEDFLDCVLRDMADYQIYIERIIMFVSLGYRLLWPIVFSCQLMMMGTLFREELPLVLAVFSFLFFNLKESYRFFSLD